MIVFFDLNLRRSVSILDVFECAKNISSEKGFLLVQKPTLDNTCGAFSRKDRSRYANELAFWLSSLLPEMLMHSWNISTRKKTDTRQQRIKNSQISQIHSKSQSQRCFYLIVNNLAVLYTLKVEKTNEVQRPHQESIALIMIGRDSKAFDLIWERSCLYGEAKTASRYTKAAKNTARWFYRRFPFKGTTHFLCFELFRTIRNTAFSPQEPECRRETNEN